MPVKRDVTRSEERREQARQSIRQEIIAVSARIIAEEGFGALTMRKLAERIGYSPAAIYLHFRNRDEIAHEVSRAGYTDLLAALSSAVAEQEDAVSRLRALCEAYVRFGLEHPQTYALIFMEDPAYLTAVLARATNHDPGARAYGLLLETAEGLMRAGRRLPKVGKPAHAATTVEFAEAIWAGLHGIVSLKLTCPAFPSASAEILTTLMVESLAGSCSATRGTEKTTRGRRAARSS